MKIIRTKPRQSIQPSQQFEENGSPPSVLKQVIAKRFHAEAQGSQSLKSPEVMRFSANPAPLREMFIVHHKWQ
jgi:hypothetical protein